MYMFILFYFIYFGGRVIPLPRHHTKHLRKLHFEVVLVTPHIPHFNPVWAPSKVRGKCFQMLPWSTLDVPPSMLGSLGIDGAR